MKLICVLLLPCLVCIFACHRKEINVEQLVEDNRLEATALLDEFHSLFNKYFEMADDQLLASAIVFPELLRYSKLRDIIETEALKTLYVQYGTQYANFSIGSFQMKPSFAEDLERASLQNRFYYFLPSDTLASNKARLNRIKRLTNSEGQVHYLFVFVQLMNLKFEAHQFESLSEKVAIYATAYQAGCKLSIDELKQKQYDEFYHTDLLPNKKTKYYAYSEISLYYYKQER